MRKLIILLSLFIGLMSFGQTEIKITQKKCISKKGFHLQLKSVFDDSRCPEGVNCVWAGEVSATIKVYKDKKLVEEKHITFNATNRLENIKWFENYYSKKIKSVGVLPYPKDGVAIKPKNQYLKIVFID